MDAILIGRLATLKRFVRILIGLPVDYETRNGEKGTKPKGSSAFRSHLITATFKRKIAKNSEQLTCVSVTE